MLRTECVPLSHVRMLTLNPRYEDMWRWGIWEAIDAFIKEVSGWGHNGIHVIMKEVQERSFIPSM
jgi:hypothetical protein